MNRTLLVVIFITFPLFLFSQSRIKDSLSVKKKQAISDAKRFKLDREIHKRYRKKYFDEQSDYFKPNELTTNDPKLLKDSGYVNAYRHAAYLKNARRKTTAGKILIGIDVALIALTVYLVVVIAAFFGAFR